LRRTAPAPLDFTEPVLLSVELEHGVFACTGPVYKEHFFTGKKGNAI